MFRAKTRVTISVVVTILMEFIVVCSSFTIFYLLIDCFNCFFHQDNVVTVLAPVFLLLPFLKLFLFDSVVVSVFTAAITTFFSYYYYRPDDFHSNRNCCQFRAVELRH